MKTTPEPNEDQDCVAETRELRYEQLLVFEKVGPYVTIFSGRIGYVIVDNRHDQCFFAATNDTAGLVCRALGLNGVS